MENQELKENNEIEVSSNGVEGSFNQKNSNLKAFLSAFVIFIVIVSIYYFFWRSVSSKTKNIVVEELKDYKYSSIKVSGFPFYNNIVISDLHISNGALMLVQNKVDIKEVKLSSIVFGKKFKVFFKDITIDDQSTNIKYNVVFNDIPNVNFSLNSDKTFKDFYYSDVGYRVISNDNKTLYTAGNSKFSLQSTKNNNTFDFSIIGDLQNLQNFDVVNTQIKVDNMENEPPVYNIKFDISSSFTKEKDDIVSSIIKITNINSISNKGDFFSLSGQIYKDQGDPYNYGELKISLKNYSLIMSNYKNIFVDTIKEEAKNNGTSKDENYSENVVNKVFENLDNAIKKNSNTKDDLGVIELKRNKGEPDYTLNGEGLSKIIEPMMK